MNQAQRIKNKQGMTLVELLTVSLLLVVVVVAFLGLFGVSFALNEHSRNVVIALNDAASVLENMRNVSPFTIDGIQASFPDGSAVPGYSNLDSEVIVVQYSNIGSDSVALDVIVSWAERGRNHEERVSTILTKR